MEVILSHFSASELRVKCLKAVEDELEHAEAQLQPSLEALKRALSVVQASRKAYKAPLVFVDESPDIASALAQLVAVSNEVSALVSEIDRQVSSSGTDNAQKEPQPQQSEESVKAEPKSAATEHKEKKKAAKETAKSSANGRISEISTVKATAAVAPVGCSEMIDLSLSDDEKESSGTVVKEEQKPTIKREEAPASVKQDAAVQPSNPVAVVELEEVQRLAAAEGDAGVDSSFPEPEVDASFASMGEQDDEEEDDVRVPTQRKNATKRRKRKAPATPPPMKRAVRDVVLRLSKRAEMVPTGGVGAAVRSALNAAIAMEELPDTTEIGPMIRAFLAATSEAGEMIVEVHAQHPIQAERHLEDMRLLMSVAVENMEHGLSRKEVCAAWKMLKVLQKIHGLYPVKTKGLHRSCLQLYNYLVKKHEVPAEVVGDFRTKLGKLLEEVDEWTPLDGLTTKWFDRRMGLVTELLEGRFEHWVPREEQVLGKVVGRLERICTAGVGEPWDDRYAAICQACSKMSRSTFFWTNDLAEEMTDMVIRCDELEAGFEDRSRVIKDFGYVTSYVEEARHASNAENKKEAFDELIDRLRWIFNAIALTRKQSLLSLARLKQLNKCMKALVHLCDDGNALNLEGCLHLENLLVVMRQVMYVRVDYAKVSKEATNALLGLFPPDKRPRFVYPEGCS